MRDNLTGRSRGFAFLNFVDPKAVNTVMVREHYLDGKVVSTLHSHLHSLVHVSLTLKSITTCPHRSTLSEPSLGPHTTLQAVVVAQAEAEGEGEATSLAAGSKSSSLVVSHRLSRPNPSANSSHNMARSLTAPV